MSERDKIIRYYRASGDAELAARMVDLAEVALKSRKYRVSEFLDPYGCTIAETVVAHYEGLTLEVNGGYGGAERVKAAFLQADFPGRPDYGIAAIDVTVDIRFAQLSHRDVLGAVLGLGIKREMIGDIIMGGQGCQIICDASLLEFIRNNLVQIGSVSATSQVLSLGDIAPREERVKEIRATVASLRLDVVAAAGFGTSRTKMTAEIEAEKLKVNWQEAKSASQGVKAGDILSMRGRGRVEICEVFGQTRKGRFSILLKRFI